MTPAEFRARALDLIDLITHYYERTIHTAPVTPPTKPGDIFHALPASAPESPDPFSAVLDDLRSIILPGITHWQAPNFYGYFPSNATFPSVLGDMLSTSLGVHGMLWATSPAATELETRVMDWLAQAVGLPEKFLSTAPHDRRGGGVIQSTASDCTLVAMCAARSRVQRALGHAVPADRLTAYCSQQAHSSVTRAAMIAGIGRDNMRQIPTDDRWRMRPEALREQLARDIADGYTPFFCCATLGTTSTGAFDPVAEIADVLDDVHASSGAAPLDPATPWLHIDAAWAGAALICPELRAFAGGLDRVDSFNFNPHKWLLTTFDCSAFWTADRKSLIEALSITPEYLRNTASDAGAVIDYRDWQVPLGRRFRALKLWFVMRHYGLVAMRDHIRSHVAWTADLAREISSDDRFDLAAHSLALVCFRLRAGDDATRALLEKLNGSGRALMTHTVVPHRGSPAYLIRWAIGSPQTTQAHIRETWQLIRQLAT